MAAHNAHIRGKGRGKRNRRQLMSTIFVTANVLALVEQKGQTDREAKRYIERHLDRLTRRKADRKINA